MWGRAKAYGYPDQDHSTSLLSWPEGSRDSEGLDRVLGGLQDEAEISHTQEVRGINGQPVWKILHFKVS